MKKQQQQSSVYMDIMKIDIEMEILTADCAIVLWIDHYVKYPDIVY